MNGKAILTGAIIAVVIFVFLILNPIVKIGAGERGVVLHWGAVSETILDEGIHWVTPISQSIQEMDVTVQKAEAASGSSSKDLQKVSTKITLNYRLDPSKVNLLYQNFKYDYVDIVITPAIDEYVKKTTAMFTAEELVTKREKAKEALKESLTISLAKSNIIVTDVYITDFEFSSEFNKAIEAKVTAEQSSLEAKNKLEQVKYEAEQQVAKARAEAETIRIQAQAIKEKGGAEYVQLQWIEAWRFGGAKVPMIITSDKAGNFISIPAEALR